MSVLEVIVQTRKKMELIQAVFFISYAKIIARYPLKNDNIHRGIIQNFLKSLLVKMHEDTSFYCFNASLMRLCKHLFLIADQNFNNITVIALV